MEGGIWEIFSFSVQNAATYLVVFVGGGLTFELLRVIFSRGGTKS